MKKKILVIVGPTASGKSALAVRLAKKFKGEIISADSRQVYKGLDVGAGKITKQEMRGIPHHLLDVADPKKPARLNGRSGGQFSVAQYKTLAENSLRDIITKNRLPIIAGGTGLYIDALTGNLNFPNVKPNKKLREKLGKKSTETLFQILKTKDSRRAQAIDPHNKVRLIRALEIINVIGKVPTFQSTTSNNFIYIGLKPSDLDKRIYERLLKKLEPMIREGQRLHKQGLTYKRMHELGLEYRYVALYLQGKTSQEEMVKKLYTESRHYAKRQMTWFSAKGGSASPEGGKRRERNKKIKWFKPEEIKEIERYTKRMLG